MVWLASDIVPSTNDKNSTFLHYSHFFFWGEGNLEFYCQFIMKFWEVLKIRLIDSFQFNTGFFSNMEME